MQIPPFPTSDTNKLNDVSIIPRIKMNCQLAMVW